MLKKLITTFLLIAVALIAYAQEKAPERMIYVPVQDWENVIKTEPKGVRLSYKEYLELLKKQPEKPQLPPAQVVVDSVVYEGKLENKTLYIQMDMDVTSLSDKMELFTFTLGTLGVRQAILDDKDAVITAESIHVAPVLNDAVFQNDNNAPARQQIANPKVQQGQQAANPQGGVPAVDNSSVQYRLFLETKGKHHLRLFCYKNLEMKRDELKSNIVLGNFVKQIFRLKTEQDMEYITEPAGQPSDSGDMYIYLGKQNSFSLTVRPKEKKDVKLPLVVAQTLSSHLIRVDSISSLFKVNLQVHHQPQKTFVFGLPEDVEIVSISENRWQTKEEQGKRILTIQTEKEITANHTITIKCEKQILGDIQFVLPTLQVFGDTIFRQEGLVYVEKSSEIVLEMLQAENVRQIDYQPPTNIGYKKSSRVDTIHIVPMGETPVGVFQFSSHNHKLEFKKKMVVPEMETTSVSELRLYLDGWKLSYQVTYDIAQGKTSELALEFPEGWMVSEINALTTRTVPGYSPTVFSVPTSSYYIKNGVLYLPLAEKVVKGDKVKISLSLQCLPEGWQSAWNKREVSVPFLKPYAMPTVRIKYLPSFLGIMAHPDFQIEVASSENLTSVDLNLIRTLVTSTENIEDLRLGFKITDSNAKLNLALARKTPFVSVMASNYIAIESERVRCGAVFAYNVKNASIDCVRFQLPSDFPYPLHIFDRDNLIKEQQYVTKDKNKEWTVYLQKRLLGRYSLYVTYEVPLKEAYTTFTFMPFRLLSVDQIKGFVGVSTTSQAETTLESKGLSAILISQLPVMDHPEFPLGKNYSHAFQYVASDFNLVLNIKLHEKADVANAILEDVTIETLYPKEDTERVTCIYTLSHLGMQFFQVTLPSGADFWSAVVDGEGEKPLKKQTIISIPIKRLPNEKANVIKIVYQRNVPALTWMGTLNLERPTTEETIPVKKMTWKLFLPPEYQVGKEFGGWADAERPWYKIILSEMCGIVPDVRYILPYQKVSEKSGSYPTTTTPYQDYSKRPAGTVNDGPRSERYSLNNEKGYVENSRRDKQKKDYYKQRQEIAKESEEQRQIQEAPKPMEAPPPAPPPQPSAQPVMPPAEPEMAMPSDEMRNLEPKEEMKREEEKRRAEDDEENGDVDDGTPKTKAPAKLKPGRELNKKVVAGKDMSELGGKSNEGRKRDEFIADNKPTKPASSINDPEKPSLGQTTGDKKIPESGKVGKKAGLLLPIDRAQKDETGVYSVKAQGLRSIDIKLVNENREERMQTVSPAKASMLVWYVNIDTARSLELILEILATLAGLVLILQRRVQRVEIFLGAIVLFTFIPFWFGGWITPYCNALVYGLLLSIPLILAYKLFAKIGVWFKMLPAAVVLIIALGFLCPGMTYAQSENEKPSPIYVPYDPEKSLQFQEPSEVFIPYETYRNLWNKAHPDKAIEAKLVDERESYCIYHASYEGKIVESQVEFAAQFWINVVKTPAVVKLGLTGTAVKEATLYTQDNKAEPITIQPTNEGYRAILDNPGQYRIDMKLFVEGKVSSKRGEFNFATVPVAASIFRFAVDSDVDVQFPDLAVNWYEKVEGQTKNVIMFPGLAKTVGTRWFQSTEGYQAKGLNITVSSQHTLNVSNHLLQLQSTIQYQIISGKLDKLTLKAPAGYTIISLACTGMERWILSKENDYNWLIVRLADTSHKTLSLKIIAEKAMGELPDRQTFPEIIPLDASRENGHVTLATDIFYNVSLEKQQSLRKTASQQKEGKFLETFRYTDHPFELSFNVKPQTLQNFSRSLITMKINEEKVTLQDKIEIEVRGQEIYSFDLVYPKPYEILDVQGEFIQNWRLDTVDGKPVLQIAFKNGLKKGMQSLIVVSFEKMLKPGETLDIPNISSPQAQYQSGNIMLASLQDISLTAGNVKGLTEEDVSEFENIEGYKKRYAFRFENVMYSGVVYIQAQKPELEVDTVINLMVEEDWLNFGYFLNYKIKFAAADTFQFSLPNEVGESLDILGDNIKDKKKTKDDKNCTWTVVLHNKVRDFYTLALFPQVMENQGKGIVFSPISFPAKSTEDVVAPSNQRLCILIQNDSSYELMPKKMEGLIPISPSQSIFLPPETMSSHFIMAYKMEQADWSLSFGENKQKPVHTTTASVEMIKAETIFDKEGICQTKIVYNIKHCGLPFLEIERINKARIWGIFVAERFTKPVKRMTPDKQEHILIPLHHGLPIGAEEERVSVTVIYSQKFDSLYQAEQCKLSLPLVSNVKEIGKVTWSVYLPRGYLYTFGGNVTRSLPINFQQYQLDMQSYHNLSKKMLSGNKNLVRSALSDTNKLKDRQNVWMEKQRNEQVKILDNLQNIQNTQQIEQQRDFADQRIQQYGVQNVLDVHRASRNRQNLNVNVNINADKANVKSAYQEKKPAMMAGENDEIFLKRQEENTVKLLEAQTQVAKTGIVYSLFDLNYSPEENLAFHFTKKQGDATLEIFSYQKPEENNFWITLQFLGFALLILLAYRLKLFSLENGYSLHKFGLIALLVCLTIVWFFFIDFIQYLYRLILL